MTWMDDSLGLLLLAAGTTFALKAKKRRFDRTNEFGIERFPTFWGKFRNRSVDLALKASAIGCLAIGAVALSSGHLDTWGWMVMAPVCLFMLYLLLGT
jgi:hypothetical protein